MTTATNSPATSSPATNSHPRVRYDSASWFVTIVGVALGLSGLFYIFTYHEPTSILAVELALVGVPTATIAYGGYWIATRQLTRADRWSVARWCLFGSVTAGTLTTGYIATERSFGVVVSDSPLLLILGLLGGAVVGVLASISTQNRHLTARTTLAVSSTRTSLTGDSLSPDGRTLASVVADEHAWFVIRILRTASIPLPVELIADQLASLEDADQRQLLVKLQHGTLPALADQGLVRHDHSGRFVELGPRFEEISSARRELIAAGETLSS